MHSYLSCGQQFSNNYVPLSVDQIAMKRYRVVNRACPFRDSCAQGGEDFYNTGKCVGACEKYLWETTLLEARVPDIRYLSFTDYCVTLIRQRSMASLCLASSGGSMVMPMPIAAAP